MLSITNSVITTSAPTNGAVARVAARPTTPSAGFSLRIELAPISDVSGLMRAVLATGADVREMSTADDGSRVMHVNCTGIVHQDAVRAAIGTMPGARARSIEDATFALHRGGKLRVLPVAPIAGPDELAMAYTPGVGRVSAAIAADPALTWTLTGRANTVAVLTDGSAVLGLGNIGPHAAMPVMEGKAALFQQFAGIDAYPICVDTSSADEIVAVAKALAPSFGGINLEDIAAPICFEVEERLQQELDIPVFHDDQHGTAIGVLAAVANAARVVDKPLSTMRVVIVGAGAAGLASAKLLRRAGVADIVGVDREGILHPGVLTPDSSCAKWWFAEHGNPRGLTGCIPEALAGADVLIGLSGPGVIEPEWLELMNQRAIVCALANPVPEVMPEQVPPNVAVMATGRSDYPNQINNVLAFPGVFRGMLDVHASRCTDGMKLAAAEALAALVPDPTATRILPGAFEPDVVAAVAAAVARAAIAEGVIQRR